MGWGKKSFLLAVLAFLVAAQSMAAKSPLKSLQVNTSPIFYVLCQDKKDVRTIRVERPSSTADCLTYYTKEGVDHEVGYGHFVSSCKRIVNNIETNLEKASWNCRSVQSVTITSMLKHATAEKSHDNP